ncbi:Anti-sigma-K factor RskA [Roseovarius azorensis]|uniref:Anti-sigma-K factor RskA n=1 Tax=Roseovarius azorensis TaxID=1287727 RepID=A0A1H7G3Q5_9RHOB|nr:anti-sigma factor [Roseovarius azorensis]SEK32137.1 Anti-sigma-K factor RskA [Roseovarius azorensis]
MSDQDQPDRDEDRILAGEYALGLLSPEAAAAFEARLVREPELRDAYAAWAEDFAAMTGDIAPQQPPARVWAGIEGQLFGAARRRTGLPGHGWLWGGVSAGVAALVLVFGLGIFRPQAPVAPVDAPYLADLAAEDGSLVVQAVYDDATGTLFVARETGAAAPGRALELWLIAGEAAPVSLGVLPEEARGVLDVPEALRDRVDGAVLAISDEPSGGSPTGAPTGAVLAAGPVRGI